MIEHLPIIVILIPLLTSFIIPLVGIIKGRYYFYFFLLSLVASNVIASAVLYRVMIYGQISYSFGNWTPPWGIEYVINPLNAFIVSIVVFIALMVAIYSYRLADHEIENKILFYTIFSLLVTGLLGILVTGDIFNLYVFLEITSLTAYTLLALGKDKNSLIASFDYIILGTISASFILLGIGYLYMVTGTLNMADLAKLLPELYGSKVVITALVFFIIGFSIKIALFPLHTWLPNVYTHAPISIIPFIAGVVTKVGIYAFIRVLFTVFGYNFILKSIQVTSFLTYSSILAIAIGSVLALAQTDIRRMFAYSSISQIGLIIAGIGLGSKIALIGSLIHIFGHSLMKSCLFMVSGIVNYTGNGTKISSYIGINKKMPLISFAFALAIFSIIGLPPSIGFISKFYLTTAAVQQNNWLLAITVAGSTLLTLAYFWRIVELAFFNNDETVIKRESVPKSALIPAFLIALMCIFFGIYTAYIIEIIKKGVEVLI